MIDKKITSTKALRTAFWHSLNNAGRVPGQRQNRYNATIRTAWVEYVDDMNKAGFISDRLSQNATL